MFKNWIVLFLAIGLSMPGFAQTSHEEIVRSGNLEGSLLVPATKIKAPVVLIIAGSGPTDRNGNSAFGIQTNAYKMLAEALAAQGIASLRYDKRGVGKSKVADLDETKLSFTTFTNDALSWIKKIKDDPRFSQVFVLGHSEGSLVGMMAAQQAKIHGFISVAGAGQPADAVILGQLKEQPANIQEEVKQIFSELKKGHTVDSIPPYLQSLFRPSLQPYLISWIALDPAAELAKLKMPIMIVQGDNDLQVPVAEAEKLHEAVPKAQLLMIEGMNHVMKKCDPDRMANLATYSQPELPLIDGLTKGIADFIKSVE